jgi:hypothetical protein
MDKKLNKLLEQYHKSFEYFSLGMLKECQECCDYIDKQKCNHNWDFINYKKDCVFCCFKEQLEKINT